MLQSIRSLVYALWGFVVYTNPTDSAQARVWRAADLARLHDAPGIDVNCVGRMIGAGLQHRIYEYEREGHPMVCKISNLVPFLRFPSAREACEDLNYIARFFAPYAVEPTEVVTLPDGSYAILQRRLRAYHSIAPADLAHDAELKKQFVDITQRNQQMIRTVGRSLDFLGREGQRKARAALIGLERTPVLSNLVAEMRMDGSERIRIMDTDLENFRPGATHPRDLLSALAARLAVLITRWLIRHFFKIDVLEPTVT